MALAEKLIRNAPKSSTQLLKLLKEGLDWPFPPGVEPEDVPLLPWDLDEIGLDPNAVAKLEKVVAVPKMTDSQPFGVFVLDFGKGDLPVGAIRRLVNRLVRKQRANGSVAHETWNLSDLLFFCQSHGSTSTIHVVAFKDTGKLPVMRVISWDTDDQAARIELVKQSVEKLRWPAAGTADVGAWREQWQSAFTVGYREGIRSAKVLAEHMADVAKSVRDEVRKLVAIETEDGPLRRLQSDLKANLIADLDDAKFADMYAQTMVYGLLTARITHPEDFERDGLDSVLKFENPLLDSLYSAFRKTGDEAFDVDEFGLHDLAETLGATNVDEALADSGDEDRRDDPIKYFYEDFLTAYDPDQRRELGTYYTPIPVVRFMVRAVDHIIKEEFGLPLGVADPTTWGEYSKTKKIAIPEGLTADDPVIRMIDPATGTGTFLIEWMRQAFENLGPKAANDQKRSVVDRMDAFEISLSSYAVAHLKTGLEMPKELRADTYFDILLTDSLAGRRPDQGSLFGDDPIAEEGRRAEQVKFDRRHSVVIGNPPYLRVKSEGTGGWITEPADGSTPIFDDVRIPATKNTIFSHVASIYNLYVYFWRWAIWKAFEQAGDGPGIVAFITASSWLDGPGFVGLRELARERSTSIHVIDLGGDGHGAIKDEGVFPIQTPVSIVVLVRGPGKGGKPVSNHRYLRVEGTRDEKLAELDELTISGSRFESVAGTGFDRLKPVAGGDDWASYPALVDLFPWQQPGCKYGRTWPAAPSAEVLERRWRRLLRTTDPDDRATCFVMPSSGRNVFTRVGSMRPIADLGPRAGHEPIVRYGFRSFDRQWAFADPRMAKTESPSLWTSQSDEQIYIACFTMKVLGFGPGATVSAYVPDMAYFLGAHGGKDIIPLYRDSVGTPNSDSALRTELGDRLRVADPEMHELLASYVFGVLAGTDYTKRFITELETPGPRVPLTSDPELFRAVAEHGARLLWLQTYGERFRTEDRRDLKIPASIRWKRKPTSIPSDTKAVGYEEATQSIRVADGFLEGVRPDVWAFEVSGMKVIPKWLGYRTAKGTGKAVSSKSPLDHIRPTEWTDEWSHELRELVHVLTATLDMLPQGVMLLDEILEGPLISADELPEPPEELRKPPKVKAGGDEELELE